MSTNRDDLNNFDLGLPEFEVASSPPTAPIDGTANPLDPSPLAASAEPVIEAGIVEATAVTPVAPTAAASTPVPSKTTATTKKTTTAPVANASGAPASTGAVAAASSTSAPTNPAAATASPASTTVKASGNAASPVEQELKEPNYETQRRGSVWSAVPSWAISTAVHVAAILGLAAWNVEPIAKELKLMLVAGEASTDSNDLQEFALDNSMAEIETTEQNDAPAEAPVVSPEMTETNVQVDLTSMISTAPAVSLPSVSQALVPKSGISAQSNMMRAALNGRSKETKRDLLKKFGGNSDTERAVSMALKWLAEHQDPETGAWTLTHSLVCGGKCDHPGERRASMNAATGLALMAFLGAGQTHMEGEYKETVFKGLSFLIQNIRVQNDMGSWYRGDGHAGGMDDMYAHGIATIAMCEAYGMTKDQRLLEAAQLGINYMAYAQNPVTGGWHYSPYPLGQPPGDTSVVGWQMMALKSGAMAGLDLDLDVVRRANFFLDSMMMPDNFSYHYSLDFKMKDPVGYRPAMTACAVLCRMYSGVNKEHPAIKAAVTKFNADGPSKTDTYYNYYATQVMKQAGGAEWESWNTRMRDYIVSSQVQQGHAAGSWYWDDGLGGPQGGRLYITCMATMILEVYYRYMPLYAEQAEEDAFQL